ncbi:hypothetical protein STEG23_036149, partial [Scotinomys teguina]
SEANNSQRVPDSALLTGDSDSTLLDPTILSSTALSNYIAVKRKTSVKCFGNLAIFSSVDELNFENTTLLRHVKKAILSPDNVSFPDRELPVSPSCSHMNHVTLCLWKDEQSSQHVDESRSGRESENPGFVIPDSSVFIHFLPSNTNGFVSQIQTLADELKDATVWKPDSCQNCRCHGDIVICKPVVCKNPRCAFAKGEVLRIAPNQCCPKCVQRSPDSCHHEGKIHELTEIYAALFTCRRTKIRSGSGLGERKLDTFKRLGARDRKPFSECSHLPLNSKPCSYDGHVYQDGEDWRLSHCAKCVCRNGLTQCFTAQCQPLSCNQ